MQNSFPLLWTLYIIIVQKKKYYLASLLGCLTYFSSNFLASAARLSSLSGFRGSAGNKGSLMVTITFWRRKKIVHACVKLSSHAPYLTASPTRKKMAAFFYLGKEAPKHCVQCTLHHAGPNPCSRAEKLSTLLSFSASFIKWM